MYLIIWYHCFILVEDDRLSNPYLPLLTVPHILKTKVRGKFGEISQTGQFSANMVMSSNKQCPFWENDPHS